jgi:hypothetical protein
VAGCDDTDVIEAVELWKGRTTAAPPEPSCAMKQKAWDGPLIAEASAALLSAAPNQVAVACLIAVNALHSGAYLEALPMSSVGTRLDDTWLRIAIATRLGAPVCAPHQCVCGIQVDESGIHGLSCRKSAGRIARHNAVNSLIKSALASAEIPSRLDSGASQSAAR